MGDGNEMLNPLGAMEVVAGLIKYGATRGVKSFPPNHDKYWHLMLYDTKRHLEQIFPINLGYFDWDGSYPKHPDLYTMHMFTLLFCSQRFPGDCRLVLQSHVVIPKKVKLEAYGVAEYIFNLADNRLGFFER